MFDLSDAQCTAALAALILLYLLSLVIHQRGSCKPKQVEVTEKRKVAVILQNIAWDVFREPSEAVTMRGETFINTELSTRLPLGSIFLRVHDRGARGGAHEIARKEYEALVALELAEKLALTGGLRPPNMNLVDTLTEEVIEQIQRTLHAAPTTNLAKTGQGVDLRSHDFRKLVPASEWLNDEIVNGSLHWLDMAVNTAVGVKNPRTQTRKCAAFSSYFFKMLREQGPHKGVRTLGRMGIHRRNFNEVDTLLLPVCENFHWTLVVVRPSMKTIAHMDSLNPNGNSSFIDLTYQWLKEFLKEDFNPEEWRTVQHEAPRQTNGWDCGVHTITNGMCLALGLNPIDSYLATDLPMQRLRLAGMLLNQGFHGNYSLEAF